MMQIPRKMSAHNVMASISRTLGTRQPENKLTNEVILAGNERTNKLYEPKYHNQKIVRVLTVVAYIISVSLAAIILSLYYMYIWDPSSPQYPVKQRINATTTTVKVCVDVTSSLQGEVTTPSAAKISGTTMDQSTIVLTTAESTQSSDKLNPPQTVKSLYKTLTTTRRYDSDYPSSTDLPLLPSISSDQFQAIPRANDDDYHDSTIAPVDDLVDD